MRLIEYIKGFQRHILILSLFILSSKACKLINTSSGYSYSFPDIACRSSLLKYINSLNSSTSGILFTYNIRHGKSCGSSYRREGKA
jgi:hypothetical protein